jgi:RNA-directed DNA polymerase
MRGDRVANEDEYLYKQVRAVEALHYPYYGITGNFERLASLHEQARRNWRKWLSRRSNNSPVGWAAFERVLEHLPLPRPRIVRRYA